MSRVVVDASAVLALVLNEPGAGRVAQLIDNSIMSSVNLAEVIGYFAKAGSSVADIRPMFAALPITILQFDIELAYEAGMLRPLGETAGLSLGDRACLALAKRENAICLTADRPWVKIASVYGVNVELIR